MTMNGKRTSSVFRLPAGLIFLAAAVCQSGCGSSSLRISGGEAALANDDGSAGYLDRISSAEKVSQNDAFRGVLMLLEIDDAKDTFRGRTEKLVAKGIVDSWWDFQADKPITRGKVAYMLYQACKVSGGVILTLTGPSRRYCLRELQYQGFVSKGSVFAPVTGGEYVGILARADAYLQMGQVPEILETSGGW